MLTDATSTALRRRGPFCRVCGRTGSSTHRPFCASCVDIFALPPGQCLYDGDSGRLWFRSTGDRSLVKPEFWSEITAQRGPTQASDSPSWIAWAILVFVGAVILQGCLQILR